MRFVCDEGVERQIPTLLRERGHNVWYVAEIDPGISDTEVLSLCREQEAILVTPDKDFGELVFRKGETNYGVVLLRLAGTAPEGKARLLAAFITKHGERIRGSFSVVEAGRTRIRTSS